MAALDIEKLRQKLNVLKDPKLAKTMNSNRDDRLWKPEENSTNNLRLIQYPYSEDPFVELQFHYGVGKGAPIPCPRRNEGKTCPVCEFATELYNDKDVDSAKKLFAKPRIYAAVINRNDENPKPRLWGFGKENYQFLLEKLLSEDYGNFLDPINGYDLEVKSVKQKGADFAKATLTFRIKPSRLAPTDKEIAAFIDAVPRMEDVFKSMTTNEILARLSSHAKLTENDGAETVKGKTVVETEAVVGEEPSADNLKDLDDAFEQAMKDQ